MFLNPADYVPSMSMPEHFDEAFALLERSFNDASFVKAYQSLPQGKQRRAGIVAPKLQRQATAKSDATDTTVMAYSDNDETIHYRDQTQTHNTNHHAYDDDHEDDDDTASDDTGSMHEGFGKKMAGPLSLPTYMPILPPTPPAHSREPTAEAIRPHLLPLPSQSGVSTPLLQQSPPTPDLTPPNTRDRGLETLRPNYAQIASSTAESFITAREAASESSAHASQLSLPLESPQGRMWLDAARPVRLGGLGIDTGEETVEHQERVNEAEGGDVTPTRETFPLEEQNNAKEEEHRARGASPELLAYREMDTNFMRNVTVRRKRLPQQSSPRKEVERFSEARPEDIPLPPENGENLHERPETSELRSVSPPIEDDGKDPESPAAINDMLYRHMRDEKSKRLSGISSSSTVVEAVVVANPPVKRRALRHAGKNLALRDDAPSNRTSLDSTSASLRRLKHIKSPLPDRSGVWGASDDSAAGLRAVSSPEAHREDVDSANHNAATRSVSHQIMRGLLPSDTTVVKRHSPVDEQQQRKLYHTKPNTAVPLADKRYNNPEPLLDDEMLEGSGNRGLPTPEASPELTSPRLRHVSAPLPSTRSPDQCPCLDTSATFRRVTGPVSSNHGNNKGEAGTGLFLGLESYQRYSKRTSEVQEYADLRTPRRSLDRGAAAKADNGTTQGLFEVGILSSPGRKSLDHGHANARNLHSSTTPASLAVSQYSDRTDQMEVNEAKAVNIYPHQNKSLLVVQHVRGTSGLNESNFLDEISTSSDDDDSASTPAMRPIFTAILNEPSTPIMWNSTRPAHVDSPLSNPRAAPLPPVIQFIPPTPVQNADAETRSNTPDQEIVQTRPVAPVRRQSLIERARRYSESFIQPFFPQRTSSTSRRIVSHERPNSWSQRDRTLHPSWRPRHDDYSDSEGSDYDYDEPLPRGGDTSDIPEPPLLKRGWSARKMSVRMPGFRSSKDGSQGFLIGNSLGIDRHGTNARRPHVSLPFTSASRTSSGGLRKRKSEEMLKNFSGSAESDNQRGGRNGLRGSVASSGREAKRRRASRFGFGGQGFGLRTFVRESREKKEEREREKRRERIRGSIGTRVYHGNLGGGGV